MHRDEKKGLVSAVMDGINSAKGQYILVMDADLSHSPEVIPKMIEEISSPDVDIVVASRYIRGGAITGWPFKRRLISKGAIIDSKAEDQATPLEAAEKEKQKAQLESQLSGLDRKKGRSFSMPLTEQQQHGAYVGFQNVSLLDSSKRIEHHLSKIERHLSKNPPHRDRDVRF